MEDDEEDIFMMSIHDRYSARLHVPERLKICLAEFPVKCYTLDSSGETNMLTEDKHYINDHSFTKEDTHMNEVMSFKNGLGHIRGNRSLF